ncbi:MAG: class I SAM-dependent rRNA methyltransferase, partial [Bryobacteraceae bacterium]
MVQTLVPPRPAAGEHSSSRASVRINRKAVNRLRAGHPWVFSSDILDRGVAQPGDAVTVVAPDGSALGTAHYSSTSQICLRMLSKRVEPIDRAFLMARLSTAQVYRERVVRDSDAFRLIHGEADLLPGLVVDRYGSYFTLQTLDQGMDRLKEDVVSCLVERFAPQGIAERNDVAVRKRESLSQSAGVIYGELPDSVPIRMNGFVLRADLLGGQKTGVFLDQRENYLAAARYAHGRALDCFTCTGG